MATRAAPSTPLPHTAVPGGGGALPESPAAETASSPDERILGGTNGIWTRGFLLGPTGGATFGAPGATANSTEMAPVSSTAESNASRTSDTFRTPSEVSATMPRRESLTPSLGSGDVDGDSGGTNGGDSAGSGDNEQERRQERAMAGSAFDGWLFAEDHWAYEEEGPTKSSVTTAEAAGCVTQAADFEIPTSNPAARWRCGVCLLFNPPSKVACRCCKSLKPGEGVGTAAAATSSGGRIFGESSGGSAGSFRPRQPSGSGTLRAPDQPTVAAAGSSGGGGVVGGSSVGPTGGGTCGERVVVPGWVHRGGCAGVFVPETPTSATLDRGEEARVAAAEQQAAAAAELELAQRLGEDDRCTLAVFAECAPQQKIALLKMMKQHAEKVSSLRSEKQELNENFQQQAELHSATLQASDHQTRLLKAEKRGFETERALFAGEIARLKHKIEEMRASFGPLLANLPESAKQALGSVSGLHTVLEECMICREVLLSGIGEKSFGLMSYACGCSRVRTFHVNCIMSMSSLKCPLCSEQIVAIVPNLMPGTPIRILPLRSS